MKGKDIKLLRWRDQSRPIKGNQQQHGLHLTDGRLSRPGVRVRNWVIIFLLCFCGTAVADTGHVKVRVHDASGAVVERGTAQVACGSGSVQRLDFEDGEVSFDANEPCSITVMAPGFQAKTVRTSERAITVELTPNLVQQSITVTASRSPLNPTDLPITETTKSYDALTLTPAVTLDDKLRQVPGFALFRRSGSQTANPTTQGVSLRGMGASGASRSLVLQDGIPINDPFGGWIYWGRVPVQSISRVELIEGGASDLYGSNALGGVINMQTRTPTETSFVGESSFGSSNSPLGSAMMTLRYGKWAGSFAGEGYRTNGYIPVAADERGAVDVAASSQHKSGDLLIERLFTKGSAFVRGSVFGESRQNGTRLQVNNATIRQLSAGADWNSPIGALTLRMYGGTENLHQTFSAIAEDRSSERLVTDQRVPVQQYGFSAQWSRAVGSKHIVTIGTDGRDITGDTNETQYAANAFYVAGGRQQSLGVYAEDVFQITPKWVLAASVRGDLWRNIDASATRTPISGAAKFTAYGNRSETSVSPRIGITRIVNDRLSLHASAYRSFRAPTLNELYRPFRVGNVSTLANADLKAEHFTGGEFGGVVQAAQFLRIRSTAFFGVLDNAVGNITLNTTPSLITRQRQNMGTVRIRGFETQAEANVTNSLTFEAGYQLTDAIVTDFASDPTLIGLRTPQVPRHSFTFQTVYDNPKLFTASLQGRAAGVEFDNDRNTLVLDSYLNLGMYVARQITPGLRVFVASENLLNSRYAIARTPVSSLAAPATVRVGLQFRFSRSEAATP